MQLQHIHVVGFGCLLECSLTFDPQRANLVLAANEAGKSTLLGAIETALYGFPRAKLAEGRDARLRFRPWEGGASRITLELQHDGHTYTITYDIADAAGREIEQWTVLRDGRDVTDALRQDAATPGAALLKLSVDDFRRSVLVRQGELELVARDTTHLVKHLESLASSSDQGNTATEAGQRLAAALEDYRARADLLHWSDSYLTGAKQWTRVEARLSQQLAKDDTERAALEQRRAALADELEQLGTHDAEVAGLERARAALRVLALAVQQREVQAELAADQTRAKKRAVLEQKLVASQDLADFPADRVSELAGQLERETQCRSQFQRHSQRAAKLKQELAQRTAQQQHDAALAPLAARLEELHRRRVLFEQARDELRECLTARKQLHAELEAAGLPLERLEAARSACRALTQDERRMVRDTERRKLHFATQRQEIETATAKAETQLAGLTAQRRARRRTGWLIGAAGAVIALLSAGLLALLHAGAAMLALGAAAPLVLGLGFGGWTWFTARQLAAYRYDQLRDRLDRLARDGAQLEQDRMESAARLDELAARDGRTAQELCDLVAFYMDHLDELSRADGLAQRQAESAQALADLQQYWAQQYTTAGTPMDAAALTPEQADGLCTRARDFATRADEAEALRRNLADVEAEVQRSHTTLQEAQRALRALLATARIELPANGADDLLPPAEWTAARRAFDERLKKYRERVAWQQEADTLAAARLRAADRSTLDARAAGLTADLAARQDDFADATAAHAALRAVDGLPAVRKLSRTALAELTAEQVTAADEAVTQRIDALRATERHTSQDARVFLQQYATQVGELDARGAALRGELERGRRFERAVTLARDTLGRVQHASYERWSEPLAARLKETLHDFLPDYALAEVTGELQIAITHTPTGQRLDLAAIDRHLSRGAKDRLFLALRLALADVLGAESGVTLPLLLDDPLANWDDTALEAGFAALGPAAGERSLVVFSCQASRCARILTDGTFAQQWCVRTWPQP